MVFTFVMPKWANTVQPTTEEEKLKRALDLSQAYYPLGVQTGVHAMIEWCGILGDYVRLLREAVNAGTPIDDIDQHSNVAVDIPLGTISYFCGKLGCLIKPFIKANPKAWRKEINHWFDSIEEEKEGAHV